MNALLFLFKYNKIQISIIYTDIIYYTYLLNMTFSWPFLEFNILATIKTNSISGNRTLDVGHLVNNKIS